MAKTGAAKKDEPVALAPVRNEIMAQDQSPLPDELAAEAGAGHEFVRPEDQAIPFLRALQSGSPQVKKGPNKIDGAEEGAIFDTINQSVWDGEQGIFVIPALFVPKLVEWRPRETGGGFVASYDADDPIRKTATRGDSGRLLLPNGNYLVETANHYVLQVTESGELVTRALLSMQSTQLKVSRKWLTLQGQQVMQSSDGKRFTPPSYAYVYRLTTVSETNDRGTWQGFSVKLERPASRAEIGMARAFCEGVKRGEVREQAPEDEAAGAAHDDHGVF